MSSGSSVDRPILVTVVFALLVLLGGYSVASAERGPLS